MSKLSLREIAQSQLDSTPVIDGQLIVCLDTGNAYRDTATAHVKIGSDLEVVSDLPLAPLAEKLYYLKPDKLYVFLGGNWTLLNDKTIDLDKVIAKLPAGSSTSLNDDVEIITQDTDTTQSHYYRRKLVVLWEYIKTKAQDFFAAKNHKHKKADITDFPTSMPASDVHPWAKEATKPSYTKAEVGLGKVDNTADADKTVKRATTAGTADTANSVTWGNVKNKPTTFPAEAHTHDDRYYTEAEVNSRLSGKVDNTEAGANGLINKLSTADGVPNDTTVFISQHNDGKTASYYRRPISTLWTYIKSKADGTYQPKGSYAASNHTHDDRYYTESEVDGKLSGKAAAKHTHDDRYYTETEINTKLNGKANSSHTHTKSQITDFPTSLKNPTALTIQTNGTTAATYDGSAAKTVNVTKGNIGLGNVDNTADANKSVKYATSAGSASTATKANVAGSANFAKETYINQYKTVNLTDLDQNTWYPVTSTYIPYKGLRRFKCNVQLNSGSKPNWSTHSGGFTAVVDILEESSGWGTTTMQGMVLVNDQYWINDSNKPPVGYSQLRNSSIAVWWLRGGGTYFLAADYDCTWTIQKSKYENSGQSASPTTTYPGITVSRSDIVANLNGNASTATVATTGVRDYNNASNTIRIGWSGADLDKNTLAYIAGYTSDMKIHTASKDGVRNWIGLGNVAYKNIRSLSNVGSSGWANQSTDDGYVPTMSFMAYWNGAYSSNGASNLQYCDRGRFGTIVTKNSGDYAVAGHTHNNINDIGSGKSTTFAYSKAGMNYGDYSWLAGWNGYELRAVNKSQFATAGHTHSFSSITDKPSSYPPSSHTHNYAGSASAGGAAISANALNPTVTLTGGDGNTAGYRLIGQVSIGQWSNRRCVMLVNSRHQGAGLVTVTIGNNTGSITQANAYAEIKYWGPTSSGSVISSSAYQVYISSDGKTGYLFWLFSDYSSCSVRVLGSDFTISNGTWMTGIGSGYGKCIATTQINAASTAGVATTAVKLARGGNTSYPMTFNWSGKSGQPTWLWGGENGTDMYVYNPSNFNVNYAKSAGSVAWGNVSGKPSSYPPSSHSHAYLPLGGGTMSGQIKRDVGCSWINDRDSAIVYGTSSGTSSGYHPVVGQKTPSGAWTIGTYSDERLIFDYTKDTDKKAGTNNGTQVYLPAQAGTIITSATIGNQTVNRAEYLANDSAYMRMHWSGQDGQPTWLWGGNDASNMYVWNPSNFSVNYANSAGSATIAWNGVETSGSNYIRFKCGVQICWKANVAIDAYGSTYTFQAAFSAIPAITAIGCQDLDDVFFIRNITKTNFIGDKKGYLNGNVSWIAVGVWK